MNDKYAFLAAATLGGSERDDEGVTLEDAADEGIAVEFRGFRVGSEVHETKAPVTATIAAYRNALMDES